MGSGQSRIGRKLKALEREVERLIDAYQVEAIDLPELKERRERIEEHGRMLKHRLSEIHERRAEREQEVRLLQGLEEFSVSVRGSLEEPSFETRQQVLRLVVDRIVVKESTKRAKWSSITSFQQVRLDCQTERLP